MSTRPPARKQKKRRPKKQPSGRRSPWAYLAPAALLCAVTLIVLILSSQGVIGHTADGGPPVTTGASGPVETLPVPDTAPPPAPPPPEPPPLPPPPPPKTTKTTKATTTTATTATTTSTTAQTTPADTTPAETTAGETTTQNDGQRVKWTVKPGDTLFSIATQFGTSVKELQRLNPDINPSALQVGQTLVVK
jgi:LysM repeat protein